MGKYLVLWELDNTRIPIDPKERGEAYGLFMAMVRQDIEKGITKDWGSFVGEGGGYTVFEGTELEVMKTLEQYVPYCKYKIHPVASESQDNELVKALSE